MKYQVSVLVESLEEGGYYAECPILPGCHVEGKNYWEALENLEDIIRIHHIEGRLEFGGIQTAVGQQFPIMAARLFRVVP
ncbi:hypothetical protein MNBD_CHLOROFLEXI01-4552 [hydrothermal vent metagenome]|uniref:HicB-like antitoxin of toxin-antitoxin system domain-containing protein n=1 Tax=hydrothermal vent metagenome TaxID=652676 RepID=A0A3B0VRT2_9ZZZZ